ncbi:MAG TPA: hypothetical protein VMT25_04890 [Thermoanaerobaculia bacterium]|nr:hypothetical protein [Thermoanaerobaculia bacterium]
MIRAISAAGLLCAGLATAPAALAHGREDAYILSFGNSTTVSSVSIDEYANLPGKRSADFLWFRRAGKAYVVEDPATLKEARALFAPLRALDPEREDLRRRQEALDEKEQELDQREDEVDRRLDVDSDDDDDAVGPRSLSDADQHELEREMSEIRARQREVQAADRDLERVERDLDAREDEIEREAEAKLWALIDEAIQKGVARPI